MVLSERLMLSTQTYKMQSTGTICHANDYPSSLILDFEITQQDVVINITLRVLPVVRKLAVGLNIRI